MVEMRFHWLNIYTEKAGTIKAIAPTVEDCIEMVEEEFEGENLVITDYYQI